MSKGADLARELGIEFKQALYSSWGNFYGAITDFPCVLFDANGFVIVAPKENLQALGIKVTKRTNVPNRIASLPVAAGRRFAWKPCAGTEQHRFFKWASPKSPTSYNSISLDVCAVSISTTTVVISRSE